MSKTLPPSSDPFQHLQAIICPHSSTDCCPRSAGRDLDIEQFPRRRGARLQPSIGEPASSTFEPRFAKVARYFERRFSQSRFQHTTYENHSPANGCDFWN